MDPTIYIGDVHGDWDTVAFIAKQARDQNATLIQVGDFGVGFTKSQGINKEKRKLKLLRDRLKLYKCKLLVIRGNHDDPSYFPSNIDDVIEFLPSECTRVVNNKKHIFIGGAISVDRCLRKQDVSWWVDEPINYKALKKFKIAKDVDVIVTHSAPLQSPAPSNKDVLENWFRRDPNLKKELSFERKALTNFCSDIICLKRPVTWIYGHFHESLSYQNSNINFKQLDIDEAWEPRI